jgi:hypothetical protein
LLVASDDFIIITCAELACPEFISWVSVYKDKSQDVFFKEVNDFCAIISWRTFAGCFLADFAVSVFQVLRQKPQRAQS